MVSQKSNVTSLSASARRTDDPVAVIGRQIAELWFRHNELDAMDNSVESTEVRYRESTMKDLHDRIYCLEKYASTLEACSLEGALVQIGLAYSIFGYVMDNPPDLDSGQDTSEELRFRRLIFSAVKALANDPELDLTELGVWGSLSENLDPWVPYEKRVAIIQKEKVAAREHHRRARGASRQA